MAKDAKGHGSEKRGGGSVPEQHQLKIARQTLQMPDAMVGVMGGPNKEQAQRIISDHDAANALAQGNPKAGAVPVHSGASGPSMADFVKNMQAGQREDSNVVRNRAGKRAYGSRWRSKDRTF